MNKIEVNDSKKEGYRAAKITDDESGDQAIVMRGPLSEMCRRMLMKYYAKGDGVSGNYSFESVSDDVAILFAPQAQEVAPKKLEANVVYSQLASSVDVEDVVSFIELCGQLRPDTQLHVVLDGFNPDDENPHLQSLLVFAESKRVKIHHNFQSFFNSIGSLAAPKP